MLAQFRKPESEGSKSQSGAPMQPSLGVPVQPSLTPSTLSARPPLRSTGVPATSVIGPDLIVQGNLISKGEVQIEGEVQGDIHGTHIVVGEKARVTGGVIAEECIIRGHVLGTVRGRRVLLQMTSHVEGDIYHQTVAIEQGAYFEGKSRRTDDPIAGIARPERRPEPLSTAAPSTALDMSSPSIPPTLAKIG